MGIMTSSLICLVVIWFKKWAIKGVNKYIKRYQKFRKRFEDQEKQGNPPLIYIYPSKDIFIMSDDYKAHFLYKGKGYPKIMCILLGDSESWMQHYAIDDLWFILCPSLLSLCVILGYRWTRPSVHKEEDESDIRV